MLITSPVVRPPGDVIEEGDGEAVSHLTPDSRVDSLVDVVCKYGRAILASLVGVKLPRTS